MSRLIRISDAASLALHAIALLAKTQTAQRVKVLAETLKVSQHHLAKVFQRLEKAGLVTSRRGPHGGFSLISPASEISLIAIYEAVDGPVDSHTCLLGRPRCDQECPLGSLLRKQQALVHEALSHMTVAGYAQGMRLGQLLV